MLTRLLLGACLCWSAAASAVDFGVMETADAVLPGHWKIVGYPMVIEAYPSQEQRDGVNVGIGYGLAERWDVEAEFANYDDESLYGGNIEFVVRNGRDFDVSVGAGGHYGDADFGHLYGYGGTAIASYTWPGTWLTLNGALDFSIDHYRFNRSGTALFGTRSEELHAVPGLQWRISRSVDLTGEAGVGLTGDARDYAAVGIAYYFQRERDDRR